MEYGGRTESILMSIPPLARWEYNFQVDESSEEHKLSQYLVPRNWV